jgi:dimethylhistidine N-methyltransferase
MNVSLRAPEFVETADREDFRHAVLTGLSKSPRAIPAKYLYDARGSVLFDEICELPEYYLTRTETEILRRHAADIASRAGPGRALVEFGSGSSVKSRLLLDAMDGLSLYSPIDFSRQHLDQTTQRLRHDYPALSVEPVCADYMALDALPAINGHARRLGFFPGSTIGNLEPDEATAFLRRARRLLGEDGALVLGADLRKDPGRLHDAYNDSAGVTAAFTLNLLRRINRELGGTFDLGGFAHDASYNEAEGRIEIYFRSLRPQTAAVAGHSFFFADGERVHTEYSYKFDSAGIASLARSGGFSVTELWTDPERLFAVAYLSAAPDDGA